MAGRSTVRIPIVVDPTGVKTGVAGVERELGGLNKSVAGIGKAAKIAIGAFAAFEVGGKIAEGIKSVTEAAIDAESSQKILAKTVNNSGISWRKHGEVIEHNLKVMGTTKGFLEGPMRESFNKLIASTHNQKKSFTDLSLAIDISRARHLSLSQATTLVAKTTQGNVTGLKRLGIATVAVTTNVDNLKKAHAAARDSGQKFTAGQNEQYKAQLDAAKAADKHATALQVLDVLQKQFGGSGKAYADSTAGGIDKINAQVEQLKIQIGQKLLPYASRFVQWLSREMPVAIATAQRYIKELTPTFLSLKQAVMQVVNFVRSHWTQISAVIKAQFDVIKAEFNLAGDILHGRWGKIWDDIKAVVRAKIRLVVAEVKLLGPLILSALRVVASAALAGAQAVANKIVQGIKSAPGKLAGLAGDLAGKIGPALSQAAGQAYTWALNVGSQIFNGVMDGIGDLYSAIAAKIPGGGHGAQNLKAKLKAKVAASHRAGGGMIPGRYSDGDVVPAMLSGGEAVLNPTQIALVNSGMSVHSALAATGAPTSGSSFAAGKVPARYVRSNLTGVKRTTLTPSQQLAHALDRRATAFGLQIAGSEQDIAYAQGTADIGDDLAALGRDSKIRNARRDLLGRILKNPERAIGKFPGAKLSAAQKTELISEQTSLTQAINDDASTIFSLLNPDTTGADTAAGGDTGSGAVDTGPTPDQQAQIDQANTRAAVATRSAGLANAALGAFSGSGDIGTSNFFDAYGAAKGGPLLVLGDARSMAAVASAATQGIGMQPYRTASTATVNV